MTRAQAGLSLIYALAIFVGLGMVYGGFKRFRTRQYIRETPRETARSVAAGRSQLQGAVSPAVETYRAPFSDDECVYLAWSVSELVQVDANDSEWRILDWEWEAAPFYLEDGTGEVLVDPTDSSVQFELDEVHSETIRVDGGEDPPERVRQFLENDREIVVDAVDDPGDAAEVGTDDFGGWNRPVGYDAPDMNSRGGRVAREMLESVEENTPDEIPDRGDRRRRYTQKCLPVGSDVYVLGGAEPHDALSGADQETLVVGPDPATDRFIISEKGRDVLDTEYRLSTLGSIAGGIVLSAAGLGLLLL